MKVAIVGGGIVGATCAYYLSKNNDIELTVFDYGKGQATKASAGIISPWFSKRRNKSWYTMARLGADFYPELVEDLQKNNFETNFYSQCGVYLLKKSEDKLPELKQLAESRKKLSPMIGELKIISKEKVKERIPSFDNNGDVLYAGGGARVEGERFVKILLNASKAEIINKKVSLKIEEDKYIIDGSKFDIVVLAVGAWLDDILAPLGFNVDIRPQKGQLRDYKIKDSNTGEYPVIMPEGELDIIPFEDGIVSVGATHENDKGFDLNVDKVQLDNFGKEAEQFLNDLKEAEIINERVGIRAYTSDFSPFFGEVPTLKNVYAISGLGSSGLTTGPIIGYNVAQLILNGKLTLEPGDYPVEKYIQR
ncbi:FAD dependent oxidoreductase [Gemella bergeri ATCC 700627]|uniref:FAD dependent oxidoreductase n=1 Tax=Gemella bergeri ATCC 700627 TaxID=1321820 RepID=U2QHS2_9BACL|nr:FAD-dependent oxidoreductase [Gemella bergeri]ERK56016.1 FAD dependent oxidoreductase [Gemella bergeri ATCC 700627]